MVKKIEEDIEQEQIHKKTKANRFQNFTEVDSNNKQTWPPEAVVYLGHLPYGFQEEQMKQYFSQYGEVLGVKLARSKTTARSKGYGFIQFKYSEVAEIVSETMNGYLLLGKVIVAHTLPANQRNPFSYATSRAYKFINWKRMFIKKRNEPKTQKETAHIIHKLLKNEEKRREKFKELGIKYEFPGFKACVPQKEKAIVTKAKSKTKNNSK